MTETWQAEQRAFAQRDLSAVDFVYVWADGIGLRKNNSDVQRMYDLTRRTRLLLELVVMAEIGVSETVQENHATVHQI